MLAVYILFFGLMALIIWLFIWPYLKRELFGHQIIRVRGGWPRGEPLVPGKEEFHPRDNLSMGWMKDFHHDLRIRGQDLSIQKEGEE